MYFTLKLLLCCLEIQCPQFRQPVNIQNNEKLGIEGLLRSSMLMVKSTGFGGLVDMWPLLSLGKSLNL